MAKKATRPAGSRRLLRAKPASGTEIPPADKLATAVWPIAVTAAQQALAPTPINDRFPIVVGQSLNASYISQCYRLATTGYLQQYVDLANEMLEQDPTLFSVVQKRIMATANGRMELTDPGLPLSDKDAGISKKILEACQTEVSRIPDLTQALQAQLWAIYYALGAEEIFWNRDSTGWHIDRFGFIHRRRLAYPNYQSWDLYIWDQGQVLGWDTPWGKSPTNSHLFGLRVGDWPGKFWIHAPQLRGDYPTRDGLARQTIMWAMLKRIGARGAASYLERFAKGFMDVSWTTTHADEGRTGPREATSEDIADANRMMESIGAGSGSGTAHPDSIQINPQSFDGGAGSKLTYQEWISLCDAQMSKAVLGGSLGTDAGQGIRRQPGARRSAGAGRD